MLHARILIVYIYKGLPRRLEKRRPFRHSRNVSFGTSRRDIRKYENRVKVRFESESFSDGIVMFPGTSWTFFDLTSPLSTSLLLLEGRLVDSPMDFGEWEWEESRRLDRECEFAFMLSSKVCFGVLPCLLIGVVTRNTRPKYHAIPSNTSSRSQTSHPL